MNRYWALIITICCTWCTALPPAFAQDDLASIRQEIERMRADYESRIAELERRLGEAEAQIAAPSATSVAGADVVAANTTTGLGNAFNPSMGVIFEGGAWSYDQDPDSWYIPGFALGGESGPAPEGLGLGETEINVSANVDDKFTAWLTLPVAVEDGEAGVEIEEAWIETLTLPAGLSARFGRMFSDVGYLNEKHAHAWDFADMPLPYKALMGNQYIDDGLRLSWVAPADLYLQFSGAVLRGDAYPFGGAGHSGFGAHTLRARVGGDLGFSNSWQAGLSWLSGTAIERASGDEDNPLLFSGEVDLWIADFVWKWSPDGNWRARNFKLAMEYIHRSERGGYTLPGSAELPWDIDQQGWYVEAVYQFMPAWRLGLRLDALSGDDPGPVYLGTELEPGGSDPRRYSLMADWSNSEFSRLRLQYTRDQVSDTDDDQLGLQYIFSIGAHGAHSF